MVITDDLPEFAMRFALMFAALMMTTACSSKSPYSKSSYTVTGKIVSPTGEPVRNAEIVLFPKFKGDGVYGREGAAVTGPDGSFTVVSADGKEGVPGGYYGIVIRPYGTPAEMKKVYAKVPRKLWQEETTDMDVEITSVKTDWEIRLPKAK